MNIWDNIGQQLGKSIEIKIGGSSIDKHYSNWLDIWYQLNNSDDHSDNFNNNPNIINLSAILHNFDLEEILKTFNNDSLILIQDNIENNSNHYLDNKIT